MHEADSNNAYGLDYGAITPVLVQAIKEQQLLIERQQKQLDELKSMIEALKSLIECYS
jgi:hypothetical protein